MEKTDLLFQMLEQPDQYSDQAWEEILADEECRELYTLMAKVKGAAMSEELSDTRCLAAAPCRRTVRLTFMRKIAALFLGIVMLSGFAYAAVRTSFFTQPWSGQPVAEQVSVPDLAPANLMIIPNDSVPRPSGVVTFDNHELADILTSICNAYRVEIVFKDEEQKHIRLHFSYDTKDRLADVIESLNTFEKFRLELKDDKLKVE